ncbi:MAG: hypothetical protein K8T91_14045 [Planctomycetes bacterium]|nr:hypothetical protein [Planctomycetota bacterium]
MIGRTYKIYVTYAADAINAATDSPYTVTHSGDSDPYTVDQQVAPDDYTSHGQVWHYLTSITIEDASDLVIELSDDVTSGRVLADAVALVDVDPTITTTYDKVGNTLTSTDAEGQTTTNVYDELYRSVRTTAPAPGVHPLTLSEPHAAPVTKRHYDEVGNVVSTEDALERVTTYERDDLDRLIEVDLPGVVGDWRYGYDLVGNMLFETDPAGNTTHYYYDAQYRQTSVAAPLNDPLDTPFEAIVDDDSDMDPDFETTGTWTQETTGADDWYGDDYTWIAAGAGSNTATWTVTGFDPGKSYEVFLTWQADASNATDAIFEVLDGVASEGEFTIDLTAEAAGEEDVTPGIFWQSLGIFTLTDGTLEVVLSDDATGRVTADAIRVVERGPVSHTTYDASGQVLTQVDSLGRVTSYEYDDLGRTIKVTSPDPDGVGVGQSPIQLTSYDHYGNVLSQTQVMGDEDSDPGRSLGDPDDLVTSFEYDNLFRRTKVIDANGDDTVYDYDLNGNLLSITDPVSNVTSYKYDEFDRQVLESVTVDSNVLTRSWEYDLTGNMLAKTDRQGRTMAYQYDNLDRQVADTWLDETGTPTNTVYSIYDIQGRLTDMEDNFSAYSYTYDDLDRVKTISNAGTPGVTEVVLHAEYDDQNRRIELRAEIDGDDDFINTYSYNGRGQLTQILQDDQAVNAVAYKRVEFDYDVADQLDQVRRYASSGNTHLVATTSYSYDGSARLNGIVHAKGMTTLADYSWQFDEANRISQFVFSAVVDSIGTSTGTQTSDYSYDDRGQLIGADHDYQTDEDYTYDENGNRATGIDSDVYSNATYTTGDHNRLESDGTYNYEYDAEGNRTRRTHIGSDAVVVYNWDVKNRLVKVTDYVSTSDADLETDPTQIVEYTYDMLNRRIGKAIDTDGDLDTDETNRYVYDGDHIALQFEGTADADDAADLAHRYIFGQEIDQILADERVSSLLSDGDVLWALTDNLGSVRQLADYDAGMTAITIESYLEYDSFGNITREETPAIDHAFGYTGRERDEETGLHFYRGRYYDAIVGRFISEDPIGFQAEDANLYRYVYNSPLNHTDAFGLQAVAAHSDGIDLYLKTFAKQKEIVNGVERTRLLGERVEFIRDKKGNKKPLFQGNTLTGIPVVQLDIVKAPAPDDRHYQLAIRSLFLGVMSVQVAKRMIDKQGNESDIPIDTQLKAAQHEIVHLKHYQDILSRVKTELSLANREFLSLSKEYNKDTDGVTMLGQISEFRNEMEKLLQNYARLRHDNEDYRQRFHLDFGEVYKKRLERSINGILDDGYEEDENRLLAKYIGKKDPANELKADLNARASSMDNKLRQDSMINAHYALRYVIPDP